MQNNDGAGRVLPRYENDEADDDDDEDEEDGDDDDLNGPTILDLYKVYVDNQRRFTSVPVIPARALVNDDTDAPDFGYSWRAACARCTVPRHMRNGRVLTIFVLNFIFLTFVWASIAYKAASESALDYVQHFTNWLWTFAGIYYTLSNLSMLLPNRFFEALLLFWMWWVYFSNVMVVFWLVIIMKYANPRVLTDEFEENGGDYYAGTVFTADFVFHITPAVYALLYLLCRIPDFVDVFHLEFVPTDKRTRDMPRVLYWKMVTRIVTYLLVLTFFASPLVVLTYYNAFDMNHVYEVDTPVYLGLAVIVFAIVTTIIGPVVLLSPLGIMSRRGNKTSWSLSVDTPSYADTRKYAHDRAQSRAYVREKRSETSEALE